MLSDKEIEEIVRSGNFTNLVASDGKAGCPEMRVDGPFTFIRCGLGINKCAIHGYFPVKYKD